MVKETLFKYFEDNKITNRSELRSKLEEDDSILEGVGVNQTIVEGYYSQFQKNKKESIEAKITTVAVINDIHVPYHNKKAMDNFIKMVGVETPDEIVLNGDLLDFYDLSSFDKDPSRINRLQEELDIFHNMLSEIKDSSPNSKIVLIYGNHEDRLRKFLWKNPEIQSLRCMDINKLLELDKLGIEGFRKSYWIGDFEFTHGKIVRKHSSYSAKCEFENNNHSGISGHVHRLGSYFKSVKDKIYMWFENGCMCNLNPEYIEGVPNWQNGWSMLYFQNSMVDAKQNLIIDGEFRFNGKVYK